MRKATKKADSRVQVGRVASLAKRLRKTRADMIGTRDEQHYWDCHDAAEELEFLEAALKRAGEAVTACMESMVGYAEKSGWYEGAMQIIAGGRGTQSAQRTARRALARYKQ